MKLKGTQTLRNPNPANPFHQEEKPKKLVYYVGFDGTLAIYDRWGCVGDIGEPILVMKKKVLGWIKAGIIVKIFTVRAYNEKNIKHIQKWLIINGFPSDLEITNTKGECDYIFDDKACEVLFNVGIIIDRTGAFKGNEIN